MFKTIWKLFVIFFMMAVMTLGFIVAVNLVAAFGAVDQFHSVSDEK